MEKEITEAKAEEEPIATTSEPVQPVSPRKLPALVLGEAKAQPSTAAAAALSPLSALVGEDSPTEEKTQSLGARRFSARIAKIRKARNEVKQSVDKEAVAESKPEAVAEEKDDIAEAKLEEAEAPLSEDQPTTSAEPEEQVNPAQDEAETRARIALAAADPPRVEVKRVLKYDEAKPPPRPKRIQVRARPNVTGVSEGEERSSVETASAIPKEMIYVWDENTGILKTLRERDAKTSNGPKTRYVEDAITGTFQKVTGKASLPKRAWGKASKRIRMTASPFSLKLMYDTTSNIFGVVNLFLQGVLGGMALISLYFFMLLDGSSPNGEFLRFYSPLSMAFSRTFFTLIVMSILGAYDKFHKDWMLQFEPVGPSQRTIDICLLALYVVALVCSVINTGYDDLLHYSYRRVPNWYDLDLSSDFKSGYDLWYALSMIKLFCCSLSWALVSFELRPK